MTRRRFLLMLVPVVVLAARSNRAPDPQSEASQDEFAFADEEYRYARKPWHHQKMGVCD